MYFRAAHVFTLLDSSPHKYSDHFINPVLSRAFDGEVSKRDRGRAARTSWKNSEFLRAACTHVNSQVNFDFFFEAEMTALGVAKNFGSPFTHIDLVV